jgi:anaerobic magnesium-protoporphyrin IX monomethyl ester cyclase
MRVLLIKPSSGMLQIVPPLGLVCVASYLRQEIPEVETRIFDNHLEKRSPEGVIEFIRDWKPDIIGITSTYYEAPPAKDLIRLARPLCKSIVLGGPYASLEYRRILSETEIDSCVVGEGELTFVEMVRLAMQDRTKEWRGIPGVAIRAGNSEILFTKRPAIENLDILPTPDFSFLPIERYFSPLVFNTQSAIRLSRRSLPIMTSRGCPFGCVFCFHNFGKIWRACSAEHVVEDILRLSDRFGVSEFHICDDVFNLQAPRVLEISRRIVQSGRKLNFCFSSGLRADGLTQETIHALKAMGTYRISIGIESGEARVLKNLNKKIDLDMVRNVIEHLVREQILTGGFFMLGLPGETEEDFRRTVDFACSSRLHTATFHIYQTFPQIGASEMDSHEGAFDSSVFEGGDFGTCHNNVSAIPTQRLPKLRRWAYRKFYLYPPRIYRLVRDIPRKRSLIEPFLQLIRYLLKGEGLYESQSLISYDRDNISIGKIKK